MALLGAQVHSVEIRPALVRRARVNLKTAGIGNAEVEEADVFAWDSPRPHWDVIVLTGSLPTYDPRFEALLAPHGRLFVVVGEAPVMEARRIVRGGQPLHEVESLFETVIDPLDHATTPSHFVF